MPSEDDCRCLTPPINASHYEIRVLPGMDPSDGRYADVAVERCKTCGRIWLHYHYEIEAFSRSGRWYRAVVTEAEADAVTLISALGLIGSKPWHLYGGSYYESSGARSSVPPPELR